MDSAVQLIELGAIILGLLGALSVRVSISPIPLYLIAGLTFGSGGILPLTTRLRTRHAARRPPRPAPQTDDDVPATTTADDRHDATEPA